MNESGQLLIYDLIFGVIILLMIIILSMYIFEENSHYYMNMQDSEKPLDILNTLSDTPYEDGYLLEILSRELDNNNTNNLTLGIEGVMTNSETLASYRLPTGFYVSVIIPGSNASNSELEKGNIITEIDNVEVTSINSISRVLKQKKKGDKLVLKVKYIDGNEYKEKEILLTLN